MGFEDIVRQRTSVDLKTETDRLATFENQWAHPSELQMNNERVHLYDIKPEIADKETPAMIVPGWGATPDIFKENMRTIVSAGRRALSVDSPHGVEHDIETPDHMRSVPDTELRRIAAFMGALEAAGVEKVSAIGHSEGGLDVILAAAIYPERFRAIVLVDPAGMIGNDRMSLLAARFTKDQIKTLISNIGDGTLMKRLNIINKAGKELTPHPKRSWDEVRALASANIVQLLSYIKSHGVGVVVMHGVDDAAFPMDRVQETLGKHIKEVVGERENTKTRDDARLADITREVLDGFVSVKGTHNDFVVHAPEYTRIAEGLLTALEEKETKGIAN